MQNQDEDLRDRRLDIRATVKPLPEMGLPITSKRYLWTVMAQMLTTQLDRTLNREISHMVVAELSCVPDNAIPGRPQEAYLLIESYVMFSYQARNAPPTMPDWFQDSWRSSEF